MAASSLSTDTKMHKYRIFGIILFCIVTIGENQALGCLKDERKALLTLKASINHRNGSVPQSWSDEEDDCCVWNWITCDVFSKRIIKLFLSPSMTTEAGAEWLFLDATFFQPFEELQNLTIRNGVMLGLKGPLRLVKLQVLDLSNSGIYYVPRRGELPSLKFLDLSGNYVSPDFQNFSTTFWSTKFAKFTNLSNLELLNLGNNSIGLDTSGKISPSIWALTSLRMLGLSAKTLNGSLPEGLCGLTNLEELDLSNNEFEGVIPTCLSNLTSLRVLDLSNNKFSGSIPSNFFPKLKSLEFVSLSHNLFEGLFSFSSFADNSKLAVFQLESDNPNLNVETENTQWKPPFFQLKIFILSNCILNKQSGGIIPSFLLRQYDLRVVYLNNNGMTGELPSWLITNNSRLEVLKLTNNSFNGPLMLQLGSYNAYMHWLDISMNQVEGEIPTFIGSILPNLTYLDMSTNAIQGRIPYSIKNMRGLINIDLSNNQICGEIPTDLFYECEKLQFFKMSNNNLTNFLPRTPRLQALYLDNNTFSGELRPKTLGNTLSGLLLFDISNNSFTGRFPDLIMEFPRLKTLVLSKNHFEGKLPGGLCNLKYLEILDLSWNNFGDTLPSCTHLPSLSGFHLQGNRFHGLLPTFLSSSYNLGTLDVSGNNFSGLIPAWIGSLQLTRLLLKGNSFHGSISTQLCQLQYLEILDLSANNFSGHVPPCLFHIPIGKPTMASFLDEQEMLSVAMPFFAYSYESILPQKQIVEEYELWFVGEEAQFVTKSVYESYIESEVDFMSGIDLSLNQFTGPIPQDIDNWDSVHSLNLSYNYFNGPIPRNLSSLINLESLDLSHNMFSGKIPSEITRLTSLSVFSVAYNNLSGPTPTRSNQFGTFDAGSYEGNPFLCGPPLDNCHGGTTKMPHTKLFVEPQQNDTSFKTLFLWSFFGSFIVSCIVAFVFFYFGTNIPQIFLQWIGVEERAVCRTTVELPWK